MLSPLQKFTSLTKVKMGREHAARRTLQEYSEWSTVHGIVYVFASSLPAADRILWGILVFTSIVNSIFLFIETVQSKWQCYMILCN